MNVVVRITAILVPSAGTRTWPRCWTAARTLSSWKQWSEL